MTLENKGQRSASASLQILGEGEHYSGKVDFSATATPTAARAPISFPAAGGPSDPLGAALSWPAKSPAASHFMM